MSKERSFRVERRGDSHFGGAEGFRAKRLLLRGSSTVAGDYLRSKGVHLPTDRLNKTVRIIKSWEKDFKIAMFSTGSKNLAELRTAKLLDGGGRSGTRD